MKSENEDFNFECILTFLSGEKGVRGLPDGLLEGVHVHVGRREEALLGPHGLGLGHRLGRGPGLLARGRSRLGEQGGFGAWK